MVDVDGVLVDGRPEGRASLEHICGRGSWIRLPTRFMNSSLLLTGEHRPRFAPVVDGHFDGCAFKKIAPHLSPAKFVSYLVRKGFAPCGASIAGAFVGSLPGIRVYLATNQEHLRAAY